MNMILYDQNIIAHDSLYKIKKEKSQDPPHPKKKLEIIVRLIRVINFGLARFFSDLARFFFQFGFSSIFFNFRLIKPKPNQLVFSKF
jgi:hypothetical protein